MKFNKLFKHVNQIHYYSVGKQLLNHKMSVEGIEKNKAEFLKTPNRTTIINYLLSYLKRDTLYLEIGVRDPEDNFNKITAHHKYSVDPGIEYKPNPVDFKLTSDEFFAKLGKGEILNSHIKFDVIFIDGLHLAEQVNKDVINALDYIKDDGFIVLHDCNPATEWHARETYHFSFTPAGGYWNGTTSQAFMKWRSSNAVSSCCIDADYGVGILSKKQKLGDAIQPQNPFYEFSLLDQNRKEYLNLISFDELKQILE